MTPVRSVDLKCHQCGGLVSSVKSIVFYCDCSATLCPGCARLQLTESRVTPYLSIVSCPLCKKTSCKLDPSTTMDRLILAVETEEDLLKAAIVRSKINITGFDSRSMCKKLIDYSKGLADGPILFDLTIDGRSDDELKTYILKAELCRRPKTGG